MKHWSIFGGGVLGMTPSLELGQRGERDTLLEAANRLTNSVPRRCVYHSSQMIGA